MLLRMLEKNKKQIASAGAKEIAKAHASGVATYIEDADDEGAVVRLNPDGSSDKLNSKNSTAA